jgi:sugar lactone lactonase YvrE
MKTNEKPTALSYLRYALLAVLLMAFSCSPDTVLESDNLESADARSKNKNDGKSANAVLKTLVKGATLRGANGVDIGPDGNLYIASVYGQEIVVMDKNNGKIIDRITEGVQSPDDLVFGPDGSLYWTDIITGEVGRRTPDGFVTKQAFLPGVNPIAFNDDGRLFIALDFLGDGLYEYDPELKDTPRTIIECPTGFCLGFFNSFDFGPDGLLYGPLFALGEIIKVNVETGDRETVASGFVNPAAAKFGPDGLLTVLDQTGEVFKIDVTTGQKTLFTTLEPGLDNMVFDEDGTLYMTNNDEGWVAEILPSGQARILSPGGQILPQGLAVLAGPNNQDVVFAADIYNVRQYNGTSGRQTEQYKGFLIPPPGVFSLPLSNGISASGGDLIVSSFLSSTVQVWNPVDGITEDFGAQVEAPMDAVRISSGEVIVSDLALGGVIRMSDNSKVAELFVASGMATDGEKVWAADWATGDIVQIDFGGGSPTTEVVFSGLSFPEGMAVDNEGRLLVYETEGPGSAGGKLTRIDLSTGERTTIVDGLEPIQGALPIFPPQWFIDDVAVGPSGDIYISGGESNTIQKIKANKVR